MVDGGGEGGGGRDIGTLTESFIFGNTCTNKVIINYSLITFSLPTGISF